MTFLKYEWMKRITNPRANHPHNLYILRHLYTLPIVFGGIIRPLLYSSASKKLTTKNETTEKKKHRI